MSSLILGQFAARFTRCWICGSLGGFRGLSIHHVARGVHRAKSREAECTLIRCCGGCHDDLDGLDPITQLAIIAIHNLEAYDRVAFNGYRSRAPDAISETEVLGEVVRLMRSKEPTGKYILRPNTLE